MAKFEYQILVAMDDTRNPAGVSWSEASTSKPLGANLVQILNAYGSTGWEVVGIGDLGFSSRSDVLLKREH